MDKQKDEKRRRNISGIGGYRNEKDFYFYFFPFLVFVIYPMLIRSLGMKGLYSNHLDATANTV